MYGNCGVWWFSYLSTLRNVVLSTVNNNAMLRNNRYTVSVGILHALFTTTALPEEYEEYLEQVNKAKVILDSTLCTLDFGLAYGDFLRRTRLSSATSASDTDGVLLDNSSLPCSLSSNDARNPRWCMVAPFLATEYSRIRCHVDRSNPSVRISLSAYSSCRTPKQKVFETSFVTILQLIDRLLLRKMGNRFLLLSGHLIGRVFPADTLLCVSKR